MPHTFDPTFQLNPMDIAHELAVHESGHTIAAIALGGEVSSVVIQPEHALSPFGSMTPGETVWGWPEGTSERTVLSSLIVAVAGYVAAYVAFDAVNLNPGTRRGLLTQKKEAGRGRDYSHALSPMPRG